MKRVAVVGAGPGGLANAMLLAAAGLDVVLYEREAAVGGRTKTVTSGDYRFDIGPTFFLYPQVLQGVFRRCGLELDDYVTLQRLDPHYRLAFENGPDVYATSDLDRLAQEISKLDPTDARNITRFIERGRKKLEAFRPVLQRPFLSVTDLLAPDVLKSLRYLGPLRSVDDDLARLFKDPRIRLAFSFQSKYLGMSPFRCPSLFTILSFLEYEFGVWHPVGGCGAVSEGMAQAARDLGVDVRLGEAVEQIEFDETKTARRVVTARGSDPVDAVVINGDFAEAIPRLIPDALRRRWSDQRIEAARYSCSTFMLYLGLEGRYDALDHHTIFLSENYRRNVQEIEEALRPPQDPSIYVQNPARTDPAFGSRDGSSLYVLVPVGHCGTIDWAREAEPFREVVLQRLERFGLTNLRARIRYERMVTPDDWRAQGIYRGATFNLSHALDQMLLFRPRNRFEGVRGVYLAGGGTHPGSGLPVIYEGARITADLVLADLGLAAAVPHDTGAELALTPEYSL